MSTASSDPPSLCIGCGSELDGMMASPHCLHCLLRLASDPSSFDEEGQESGSSVIGDGVLPRFDDYELIEEIARGGMGVVYRAKQLSLSRIVAVKMILAGQLATPDAVRRFQFEAEAAARLEHPGIVPIYEVGESESQHFFSMKLIDGSNLAESIDMFVPHPDMDAATSRHRQLVIAELMSEVAEAITFAHEHGVMHRDLKPTNILLDQDGKPHLTDFGLARLVGVEEQGVAATLTSTVLGSPAYMSPEQALGDSANVTVASDVYGIGVVLYELLTGQPPFVGKTVLDTLRAVVDEEPVSPRTRNPKVDADLETIALRCLEKRPSERYSSVADVSEELNRFLQGRPILARPVGTLERVQRWCARKPVIASLLSALLLVTVAGVFGVGWQWREAILERTRADENAARATLERDAALWQTYRSSIALASSALELHQVETVRDALKNAPEKHRNWEWRYFRGKIDVPCRSFTSKLSGTPSKLWFSRDGSRLACSISHEFDGGITKNVVWNTESGAAELEVEVDSALSQDLRYLATNADGEITILDRATEATVEIDHSNQPLLHMIGFGDSSGILVTQSGSALQAWDIETGTHKSEFPGAKNSFYGPRVLDFGERYNLYQGGREMVGFDTASASQKTSNNFNDGEIHTVAHHPTSKLYATAREFPANNARIWDAGSGQLRATLEGHSNVVYRMKFSPQGTMLATGSLDSTTRVWDTEDGTLLRILKGHTDTIQDISFCPNEELLITGSYDGTARIWDVQTGSQVIVIPAGGIVAKVAFHPNGRSVATSDDLGNVRVWNIARYLREQLLSHEGFVYALDHHPDGNKLASGGWDRTVRVWDIPSGKQIAKVDTDERVGGISFSPDGKRLAYTTPNQLGIVDVNTLETVSKIGIRNYDLGTKAGVRCGFNSAGTRVACGVENTAVVFDVLTGKTIEKLRSHDGIVTGCQFIVSRNRWVVAGGHQLRCYDAQNYSPSFELTVPGNLMSLTFNSDGTEFCVTTDHDEVHFYSWHGETPIEIAVLQHPSTAYSVAFSHDNSRIFVGCHDGTIRLWDTATASQVAILRGHASYVHALSMSPTDPSLASGSGDFTIHIRNGKR